MGTLLNLLKWEPRRAWVPSFTIVGMNLGWKIAAWVATMYTCSNEPRSAKCYPMWPQCNIYYNVPRLAWRCSTWPPWYTYCNKPRAVRHCPIWLPCYTCWHSTVLYGHHATLIGLSIGQQMYIPCGDHAILLGIDLVWHGTVLWNYHATIVNI